MTEAEVWQRLDHTAGRPSRRTIKMMAAGIVAATVISLAVVALAYAGVIAPRLGEPRDGGGLGAEYPPGRRLTVVLQVENHGLVDVSIVGAGEEVPGMRLEPAQAGWFPIRLPAGQVTEIRVAYQVTDCTQLHRLATIPVRIERRWGTQTGRVPWRLYDALPCETAPHQG